MGPIPAQRQALHQLVNHEQFCCASLTSLVLPHILSLSLSIKLLLTLLDYFIIINNNIIMILCFYY